MWRSSWWKRNAASAPLGEGSGAVEGGMEEGELRHDRSGGFAAMVHRDLEVEAIALLVVGRPEMRECEILFEQRRPAAARRVPHLYSAAIHGLARAPGDVRQTRRKAPFGVNRFERIPIHRQPDKTPRRRSAALVGERASAVIRAFAFGNGPGEVDLER